MTVLSFCRSVYEAAAREGGSQRVQTNRRPNHGTTNDHIDQQRTTNDERRTTKERSIADNQPPRPRNEMKTDDTASHSQSGSRCELTHSLPLTHAHSRSLPPSLSLPFTHSHDTFKWVAATMSQLFANAGTPALSQQSVVVYTEVSSVL